MNTKKYFIIAAIIFIMGFLVWGIYLPKDSFSDKEISFQIKKGEGSREISLNLERAGLIKWAPLFRLYALTIGAGGNLQAGSYSLNSGMNVPQIVAKFIRGDVIKDFLTIPEGWDLRDIGTAFEKKGMFKADDFWQLAGFPGVDYSKSPHLPDPKDFSGEFPFLREKPDNVGLEGYLFPDTYQTGSRQSPESMIKTMLANFDKKLTMDLRAEINRRGKTIFEIVTMASLIEKEVRTQSDKARVSGILWKRLKIGMPLQVDATVSYITGKPGTELSKSDMQTDSPFNTYKHKGLPFGPISNPGMESIRAALYPEDSQDLYYLSAPDGTTIFSRTLEEHNAARTK